MDSFIKKDFSRLSEFTVCADLFGDVFRSDPSFKLFAATPFAITAVLADVLIAGSLCVLLHGSRTGFRRCDSIAPQTHWSVLTVFT